MARSNSGSTKKTASSRTSKTKIDKNVQVGRIMAEEERAEFYCSCCGKKYTKQKETSLIQIARYLPETVDIQPFARLVSISIFIH